MKREGNDPKRRLSKPDSLAEKEREKLAKVLQYVGSPHHKRFLTDYGFERVDPRADKTLCDGKRKIPKAEAVALIRQGVMKGLFSEIPESGYPKYIWSVDSDGEPYEAKTDPKNPGDYHGYPFKEDDPLAEIVVKAWAKR